MGKGEKRGVRRMRPHTYRLAGRSVGRGPGKRERRISKIAVGKRNATGRRRSKNGLVTHENVRGRAKAEDLGVGKAGS